MQRRRVDPIREDRRAYRQQVRLERIARRTRRPATAPYAVLAYHLHKAGVLRDDTSDTLQAVSVLLARHATVVPAIRVQAVDGDGEIHDNVDYRLCVVCGACDGFVMTVPCADGRRVPAHVCDQCGRPHCHRCPEECWCEHESQSAPSSTLSAASDVELALRTVAPPSASDGVSLKRKRRAASAAAVTTMTLDDMWNVKRQRVDS